MFAIHIAILSIRVCLDDVFPPFLQLLDRIATPSKASIEKISRVPVFCVAIICLNRRPGDVKVVVRDLPLQNGSSCRAEILSPSGNYEKGKARTRANLALSRLRLGGN